jgi:LacI family transcriptional regulator
VSRALRDDKAVNNETKQKVLAFAKTHGYQINRNALQLRGNPSNVIGVIVPNIYHNFFSNIISYITNFAFANGYIVSVFQSNESISQEEEIIKAIVQNNIAGVMASLSMESTNAVHFQKLKQYNIPLVLFDRVDNQLKVPRVTINNSDVLEQTIDFLVQKGKKHIAYLSGKSSIVLYSERQKGYKKGITKNNLQYTNIVNASKGFNIENGITIAENLLNSETIPDAIICDSHLLMQGIFSEIKKAKQPIHLVTFGGYKGLASVYPGVTFIQQPENEIACEAFNLLLKCIQNEAASCNIHKEFDAKIIDN